jgi:hypothetical protein
MAERVELGSLGSKAEHLLDLALRAAANGRIADSARPAASAARYFHHADASVRTVRAAGRGPFGPRTQCGGTGPHRSDSAACS